MIKFENVSVMNVDNAIRGMRNAMNSWHKSDSYWTHIGDSETFETANYAFFIGEEDLKLARKLIKSGSDHRKFLRQIFVSVDITAPLYWFKEAETYKVGTTSNSTSTMHTIHKRDLTLDDFSHEHLEKFVENEFGETWVYDCVGWLREIVDRLNFLRKKYIETKDKKYWNMMIQLLPSSYNQMRTITLNFEVLYNMYHARKNHKLSEWHDFCNWIENLPHFAELCLDGGEENVQNKD